MGVDRITIDPLSRVEGHLKISTKIDQGVVSEAKVAGELFRGIEKALIGYDARTAIHITQRVCGVCQYAHAEAAAMALEDAMGLKPNPNGQLLRNLVVGANQIQDYLFHFYQLSALDFIDVKAVLEYQGKDATLNKMRDWVREESQSGRIFPAAPLWPRLEGELLADRDSNLAAVRHYLESFTVMAKLHKMVAIFGGKSPQLVAIEAGGVTTRPTVGDLAHYRTLLKEVADFIHTSYRADVMAVCRAFPGYFQEGKGYGNLLSYPYFPAAEGGDHLFVGGATMAGELAALDLGNITEDHAYSFYHHLTGDSLKPLETAQLTPISWDEFQRQQQQDDGKYSWGRAPRYQGRVMEVGPAARVVNTYLSGRNPELNKLVSRLNRELGIELAAYNSVLGRHLSRYITVLLMIERLREQLEQVVPDKLGFSEREVPRNSRGTGITEATRGALGHWVEIDKQGLIKNYEMVVPSTWNLSPRDKSGQAGAVEQMLLGTRIKDQANPLELARIVRAVDPCVACSVH